MRNMARTFVLFMSLACTLGLQAQNFGYVKTDEVLSELPAVKAAESNLSAFQAILTKKREQMIATAQAKYQDVSKRQQEGTIAPAELAKEEAALQAMQDSIGKYEQEIVAKYQDRKATELQPILDSVNEAIKAVAKENNYTYIFDYGSGILLYADETKDITKLVKTKLGIVGN